MFCSYACNIFFWVCSKGEDAKNIGKCFASVFMLCDHTVIRSVRVLFSFVIVMFHPIFTYQI